MADRAFPVGSLVEVAATGVRLFVARIDAVGIWDEPGEVPVYCLSPLKDAGGPWRLFYHCYARDLVLIRGPREGADSPGRARSTN